MNKLRNCLLHKKHTISYKYVEKKLIINLNLNKLNIIDIHIENCHLRRKFARNLTKLIFQRYIFKRRKLVFAPPNYLNIQLVQK